MISCLRSVAVLFSSFILTVNTAQNGIKDAIGFPEFEENPLLVNKQNRNPVFLPSTCPENELYYPGDQTDDWICDCRSGYLFHPDTDKCWPALRRGPCPPEEYLILLNTSMVPKCAPNPCKEDSMVLWEGQCTKLGSSVCGSNFPVKVLWVNATTIQADCVNVYVDNRSTFVPSFDVSASEMCLPGCRRSIQSKSSIPKSHKVIVAEDLGVHAGTKFTSHLTSYFFRIISMLI